METEYQSTELLAHSCAELDAEDVERMALKSLLEEAVVNIKVVRSYFTSWTCRYHLFIEKNYEKCVTVLEKKLEIHRHSVDQYRTMSIRLSSELDACKSRLARAQKDQTSERASFQQQIEKLQKENEVELPALCTNIFLIHVYPCAIYYSE